MRTYSISYDGYQNNDSTQVACAVFLISLLFPFPLVRELDQHAFVLRLHFSGGKE